MSKMTRRGFGLGITGVAGMALGDRSSWARVAGSEGARTGDETRLGSGLTDVRGIKVGHYTDKRRPTGCTAILFDNPVAAGVDYDGSAPGEQMVVTLQPVSPLEVIHGILLTGGGPMGLGAVAGATRYLEERHVGYDWGVPNVRVPVVVGAVIDDLSVGDGRIRPDPEAAYEACRAASSAPVAEGNVGAGSGATVGKMLRSQGFPGMKGGLGTSSLRLGDVVIGALAVVNAAGDILEWRTGKILAGARRADGKGFANIQETLKKNLTELTRRTSLTLDDAPLHSTTLAVVATNASFTKTELTKIAMMANCGAARAISPYHTTGDGDQLFALSTRELKIGVPLSAVGAIAAEVVAEAINRAVKAAHSVEGWPAYSEFR